MICPICKKDKPKCDYHKNKRNPRGIHSYCKECRSLLRRGTKREKGNPLRSQKWRDKNKHKARVEAKARWAFKKGLIEKRPCKVCGGLISEMHHPDYSKPHEVIWLCDYHHSMIHH